MNFEDLKGKTIKAITNINNEKLRFDMENGKIFLMHHWQSCCEGVSIEDIDGDLEDLIGTPILLAEEATEDHEIDYGVGMYTFYKLNTIKGDVTIRWYGSSNGYYGVSVSFDEATEKGGEYYDMHDWRIK